MKKINLSTPSQTGLRVAAFVLVLLLISVANGRAAEIPSSSRTWKTVDELSLEELQNLDLRTETPRDSQISYIPAEAYPFTAPYTAEEMGYRVMEFTQRPRWSCAFANLWGSITPHGVLL